MFALSKHLWRWTNTPKLSQGVGAPCYGELHVDYALSSWIFMDEQTACITLPWALRCLWSGYIISVYWMLFSPLAFRILYIYRTGNLWHMTLPRQEMYPAVCCFCEISTLFACRFSCRVSSCTHTHTHSYSSDNCPSSPALRSWTGLTTSVCINTLLLPLGRWLFIAVMFTRT